MKSKKSKVESKRIRTAGYFSLCALYFELSFKASSSIGRAAVSKTAGWGFDSLLACHECQEMAAPVMNDR